MLYFPIKRIVKIGSYYTSASTQFLYYGNGKEIIQANFNSLSMTSR